MTHVIARITAKPGSADTLRQLLGELVGPTRQEAGCLSYHLYQRESEAEVFYTVEEWRDAASVAAHLASPHVAAAIAGGGPHIAAPPEIEQYDLLA
jgi:quinol monooxygenase YgiN